MHGTLLDMDIGMTIAKAMKYEATLDKSPEKAYLRTSTGVPGRRSTRVLSVSHPPQQAASALAAFSAVGGLKAIARFTLVIRSVSHTITTLLSGV